MKLTLLKHNVGNLIEIKKKQCKLLHPHIRFLIQHLKFVS